MSVNTATTTVPTVWSRTRPGAWISTVSAAVLLPVLLWALTVPVGGLDLAAAPNGGPTMHIGIISVIAGGLISSAGGLAFMTLLHRISKTPTKVWLIATPILLLLSMTSPFSGTTTTNVLILIAMHLLVGASVIIGALRLPIKQ